MHELEHTIFLKIYELANLPARFFDTKFNPLPE
jgi:hypothetical protein